MEFDKALTRKQYVCLAKLADKAERYGEMVGYMVKIMRTPAFADFTVEERRMFCIAYKDFIDSRRRAWRVVFNIEHKEEGGRWNEANAARIKAYRARIEAELSSICEEVLGLLNSHLIPSADSAESKVFYLKMKGDYYRYLAEFKVGEERRQAARDTAAAYYAAQDVALVDLAPTHPIRLALHLNFSVFFYGTMNSLDKACSMLKEAVELALNDLDNLGPDSNMQSTSVMQLMRENLSIWTFEARQRTVKR